MFGFSIEVTNLALAVMILAIVVDWGTARFLHQAATKYSSPALETYAYNFTTDIWRGGAVLVGLAGARLGYREADLVAATVVAIAMIYVAFKLGRKAVGVLTDASPGAEVESRVREVISAYSVPTRFHTLRLRQAGGLVFLDLCLHVPPEMSISRAHEVAEEVSRRVREAIPSVREAVVHVEPEAPEEPEEPYQP